MITFMLLNPVFALDKNQPLQVDLYLTTTCPHCQKADLFFQKLVKDKTLPLQVNRFYIDQDKTALKQFYSALKAQGFNDFAVPSIFFCDSRWSGFDEAGTSGKKLLDALEYCQNELKKTGKPTPALVKTLRQWAKPDLEKAGIIPTLTVESYMPFALILLVFAVFGVLVFFRVVKKRK